MKNCKPFIIVPILLFTTFCQEKHNENIEKYKSESEYGQYAPEDAFFEDERFAYYGSENQWNRRMFSEKAANNFYKRRNQRQLLEILDGNIDNAIDQCKSCIENDKNDLESLFILTIAYCQIGNINEALNTANLALDKGFPIERFLVGPRELLEPLYNNVEFQAIVNKQNLNILHGPLLGSVTDSSVKIWFRTLKESTIKLELFDKDSKKNPINIFENNSITNDDYTCIIAISNLEANKKYYYNILVDGITELTNLNFKTYPKRTEKQKIRVSFGGGAGYTPEHESIWNIIDSRNPDAMLMLGDNVYIDLPGFPNSFHDYTYYRRQSSKYFRKLVSHVSTFSIWDDHDAAIDDVWLGPYLDKPKWKMPTLKHFKINWNNPAYGTDEAPGCYYKFSIGDVDFIMLDCRFYRTNPFKEDPSMIGPKQKEWLKSVILSLNGTFKVLVSSVPWAKGAKPGSHDTWDGFDSEREEIFQFIEKNKIEGIILLSADRHRSDAWKIKRENGYDFYEFMSSKLTNIHTHELMQNALLGYNAKCSFGELNFNFDKKEPEVTYNIINIDGDNINSLTIKHSQLTF
ncbi:MAG: alkaline phosphatase family protein [Ignavibacteriales bacterium]|nr:alkaline phosphatase family protein [Ignavibacteriales bacterium]MCB9210424.1 alkaline phosphatase family protein [Ignavibacteriales bacterium]MCB9219677.1 alkaline phosphatase family protein [Ignavibacteriales bacterium]